MKLNNKGMSLMELLVSIVLIGIVLTFLFQMLVDLKNETTTNNYAYNNQVNRTEAIYTIEKDLLKYALVGVEDKSSDNLKISFYYEKNDILKEAILSIDSYTSKDVLGEDITKYYLRYTSISGEKYSWEMKGAEVDPCGLFTYYVDSNSNNYYMKLNIYLYNIVYHDKNNRYRNNVIDDIEITYAGSKDKLAINNDSYLTNNIGYKNIGICTN